MKINKINFDDYEELTQYIFDDYINIKDEDEDGFTSVSVIADGFECGIILSKIFGIASEMDVELFIESIELDAFNDDEDFPYMITIDFDGGVWCDPALTKDGKMVMFESEIVYVAPQFISNTEKNNADECVTYVYTVGDEPEIEPDEDDDFNKPFVPIVEDDDEVHGFHMNLVNENGPCFHAMYCSCEPQDFDKMCTLYNAVVRAYMLNR